jgi:hypothetical protein
MASMTLASLGWGTWWVLLFLRRFFGYSPGLFLPSVVSTVFATLGLGLAVWCFRAQRSWLLFVMIPFLANLSLLFMPWLAEELTTRG